MEFLFKVLLIGDPKVGKTSFVNRYVHDTFYDEYKVTIGVDFALKEIYWHDHRKIKLQLWDIAGQERYSSMTRVYYKESSGCILMFDLSDRKSFNSVLKWKRDLDSKCIFGDGKPIPCILLANKSDIKNRSVEQNDIEILCKENGFIGWSEISVKENLMIENSIDYLIECILDRHKGIEVNLDNSSIPNNRNGIYRLDDKSQNKKVMCGSC